MICALSLFLGGSSMTAENKTRRSKHIKTNPSLVQSAILPKEEQTGAVPEETTLTDGFLGSACM